MATSKVEVPEALAEGPGGVDAVRGMLEGMATRRAVLQQVTEAVANQPMAVGTATAGQIALVDQAWREMTARYGTLDAGGYAELVGAAPTTRSVASKARSKGLVGYQRGRRILYPCFQFDERGLRPGWREIVSPLREAGWQDEDIILWLAAPHGSLGRHSPVETLDSGQLDTVLAVVRAEASGVW